MKIIIPSKSAINLSRCIPAVLDNEPDARIIVVADGKLGYLGLTPAQQARVKIVAGVEPFVFARNVNIGIEAAGDDDVLLLNDDALLQTPLGFSSMAAWTETNNCSPFSGYGTFGVCGPLTNSTGNPHQFGMFARFPGMREEKTRALPFLCVYIPRRTIGCVGLLDERFVYYGWEDVDYCRRVKRAGLKIGIYDGCFVDHLSLKSTFRGEPGTAGDIEPGRRLYIKKWGDDGL